MQNFEEFDLDEARMSAAVRMQRAIEAQRAKSDASRARTPSSIPKKEEPKKDVAETFRPMDEPRYDLSIAARQKRADSAAKAKKEEPKKQGVAEASDRMQRYGQLILKRVKASQAAEPQSKKEEPRASSNISSMSMRDSLKLLKATALARKTKKPVAKGLKEDNEHYQEAEEHLSKANDAEAKGHMKSFHTHMANHHDAMSEWHDSKGRSASADKHADKAEMHHEKSLTVKEETDLDEAAWGKDKITNLRQAHDRHMEKALTANKAGDDEAVKTHQRKMQMIKTQMQKLKQNEEADLNEAGIPKNHTIEAHGIRGMKATPWRKTFKNHEHLSDWADKNDSVEVHATRDLEQAKKGNLSPAMRKEEILSFNEFMTESALTDRFSKYTRPVVKTTPKIERHTNPSGRTNDHVEWKVTTHTGEVHRHNSKKEAQAHFDSLPK